METKQVTLTDVQFNESEDSRGQIKAVFATLNVVDHHGDLIEEGAISPQKVKVSDYGHSSWPDFFGGGELPIGKGEIHTEGDKAIFEGELFVDDDLPRAKAVYATLKGLGSLQEWSFSLEGIKSKVEDRDGKQIRVIKRIGKVREVSPVWVGAGRNTRTLSVKGVNMEEVEALKAENTRLQAELDKKTEVAVTLEKNLREAQAELAKALYRS